MIKMNKTYEVCFDLETTGLNPLEDRIIAIGIKLEDEEVVLTYNDEKQIIKEFWNYLRKFNDFKLIGFNSAEFDIPFLIIRSLRYKIPIVKITRYNSIDLKLTLSNGFRYKKGKLEEFSKLINYKTKYNGYKGKHIPLLWDNKQIAELIEYVMQDAKMTFALFQRLKEIGAI